jgi:hypothetical protein
MLVFNCNIRVFYLHYFLIFSVTWFRLRCSISLRNASCFVCSIKYPTDSDFSSVRFIHSFSFFIVSFRLLFSIHLFKELPLLYPFSGLLSFLRKHDFLRIDNFSIYAFIFCSYLGCSDSNIVKLLRRRRCS